MIGAVIPTRYNPPELPALLDTLRADGIMVWLLQSDRWDHRIYRMWNAGTEMARMAGCETVAILNDDIAILPGTLPLLSRILASEDGLGIVYPDVNAPWGALPNVPLLQETQGTWSSGGMTGFCFCFRAGPAPRFDEGFGWWYGDDAFEADFRRVGYRVARVRGVPIRHERDGSARKDWDRLGPIVQADRARWQGRVAV